MTVPEVCYACEGRTFVEGRCQDQRCRHVALDQEEVERLQAEAFAFMEEAYEHKEAELQHAVGARNAYLILSVSTSRLLATVGRTWRTPIDSLTAGLRLQYDTVAAEAVKAHGEREGH